MPSLWVPSRGVVAWSSGGAGTAGAGGHTGAWSFSAGRIWGLVVFRKKLPLGGHPYLERRKVVGCFRRGPVNGWGKRLPAGRQGLTDGPTGVKSGGALRGAVIPFDSGERVAGGPRTGLRTVRIPVVPAAGLRIERGVAGIEW